MADPFVAEIRMFSGNFAPTGWAFCDGQLLPISQNTALFSLLGTIYGGDGKSTFALPDLQGRTPMHHGQGVGLTDRQIGEPGGAEAVTLTEAEIPAHSHPVRASNAAATTGSPSSAVTLAAPTTSIYGPPQNLVPMAAEIVGGGQPHNNRQPYLVVTFIIALQGVFPPRS